MKKILVTSTDLMMVQFLAPHILHLRSIGYHVDVACSNVGNRINEVIEKIGQNNVFQLHLSRSPFRLLNLKGFFELEDLMNRGCYDLVWTNEPVMGVITRLAARKARNRGTRVVYMVHGYHFFKGSAHWLWMFYPIERLASKYCDAIITINCEDYQLTKEKFFAHKVYKLNGIGIDEGRFNDLLDRECMRKKLGLSNDLFLLISVGELKPHKNHETLLRAVAMIHSSNVHCLICGKGELLDYLKKLATELGVEKKVHFLGYRKDIPSCLNCSDLFVFPSCREGLGLAALEAMYVGLPVVGSNVRGIVDYVRDNYTGFLANPKHPDEFATAIDSIVQDQDMQFRLSENCKREILAYRLNEIKKDLARIINTLMEDKV